MNVTQTARTTIFWSVIGACLEWYEFSVFTYVAPMIASAFFPKENPLVGLFLSFGVFAAGYLMRPLGGIVFGNLGDKLGRKKILILTTRLMMIPMLGTAILPTYHQWGLTAVILLLSLRMLQGLSVGGEYTTVLTMVLENAPSKHRALTTSSASVVSGLGVVLSAVVVTALTYALGEHRMYAWGWRIPFFIGFLLAAFAYYCQLKLHESPYFKKAMEQKVISKTPVLKAFKEHYRSIFYVFLLAGFLGIPCYIGLAFFPNYLIKFFHMKTTSVLMITTLCTLIYLPFIPVAAAISDRIGRKPILIATTILFILIAYPAFHLINSNSLTLAFWGNAMILIVYGCVVPVFVTMINELFPTQQRLSGVSTGYNLGNAVFGGTTPMISQYLIMQTGSYYAPAYYLMVAAAITLCFIFTMPETRTKAL